MERKKGRARLDRDHVAFVTDELSLLEIGGQVDYLHAFTMTVIEW